MEKKYNHVRTHQTRFSYNEFCKMAFQMSAKDDFHFSDFKRLFEKELKAIYNKSGEPIRLASSDSKEENHVLNSDYIREWLSCNFTKSNRDHNGAEFFTIRELQNSIQNCAKKLIINYSDIHKVLTEPESEYEITYYRKPYTNNPMKGVWLIMKDLPF